jgi:hypothetical protein
MQLGYGRDLLGVSIPAALYVLNVIVGLGRVRRPCEGAEGDEDGKE